jgi:hypothetical protein
MKKFFALLLLLMFVIAPLGAWTLVQKTHPPLEPNPIITATKPELFSAIKKDQEQNADATRVYGLVSFKQYHNWWFIVTVETKDDETDEPGTSTMLLSKFTNEPDAVRVVVEPGYTLPLVNISGGRGVPYDVIETLSKGAEL